MAANENSQATIVGPVPFKDIVGDAAPEPLPEEYKNIVSTLPSYPNLALGLRCYEGTWLMERTLPGIIFIQRSFVPRRGDIILASPAKCGTTWLKALAFAVMARGVYPVPTPGGFDDDGHPLLRLNPHDCVPFLEGHIADGWGSKIIALPSPRLMATHMKHSALPASIISNPGGKIVYICREPKDMLVSAWHFDRKNHPNLSFLDLFESVCEGKWVCGAIWDHILEYWNASKASPETVLFLLYEDMLSDPADNTRKLARFLGHPFSGAEEESGVVMDIVSLCSFDKLKNLEVNKTEEASDIYSNKSYFRKGKTGDWVNYMTPEMARRFDAIVEEKMCGSGLSFT